MDVKLNSNHGVLGKWGKMEADWAKALNSKPPKKVEVTVKCVYEGGSGRPSSFV
jgi:hypothetical protein